MKEYCNLKELGSDMYVVTVENFTLLEKDNMFFNANFANVSEIKVIGIEIKLDKYKENGYKVIYTAVPKEKYKDYFATSTFNSENENFDFINEDLFFTCKKVQLFEEGYNKFWFDDFECAINMAKKINQNCWWIKEERYKEDSKRLKTILLEKLKEDENYKNESEEVLREKIEAMF